MVEAKIEITLSNGGKAGDTLKELTKQANTLNKEIKDLKPGTEAFAAKAKDLQAVNGKMGEIKNEIKGTTQASDGLKNSIQSVIPGFNLLGGFGQKISGVTKGVGGLTNSFGLLRGAIVATGIGALVVVLGSLISYFTTTQEGIDKVSAVTRPLAAVFERLKGVLQELGQKTFKALADAIDNPKQAMLDLGNIIQENIINRFKAIGLLGPAIQKIFSKDWKQGLVDLGNAALQVGTGVEDMIGKITRGAQELGKWVQEGIDAGARLDALQKAIERAEIKQIQRSKELDLIIKQQKAIVEDVTKSYDDRRAAAEAALNAQQELMNGELALLDKRIEKMKLEHSLNDTSRENEKELAELTAKKFELQAKVTEQSIEFSKKIIEINKAQAAEELAIQQNLENLRLEVKKDGIDKEIELIELETQRKIEALKGTEQQIFDQRLQLEELQAQQIQAVRDKYAEEALEAKQKAFELDLAIEQNLLNEAFINKQITEQQFTESAAALALNFQRQKLDMLRAAHGEESIEYQRAHAEYLNMMQATADSAVAIKKKEQDDQQAALMGTLAVTGDFFGSLASFQSKGTAQWKAFASAQAIMSAIQGSINAYTSTSAIPIVGPGLAPIAAGIALAAGIQNVKRINATKAEPPTKPKARRGFLMRGPSHEQGGIDVNVEGDELIMTRGVFRNPYLRRIASEINVAAGGISFDGRAPVNSVRSFAAGGVGSMATTPPGENSLAKMEQFIMALVEAQDRRIDRIQVENVVTQTQDKINVVNAIQAAADF